MATLGSSSTLDEIKDAYADNASYIEDDSVAKAKIFVTACTLLLLRIPKDASQGGGERVVMNPELLEKQRSEATTTARPAEPER